MDTTLCPWESPTLLFFSSNVPALVYYSHVIALISAISIASVVFVNNSKSTVARLLVLFAALFSLWTVLDVALWATNDPSVVMFAWSLQVLIEPLTFLVAFFTFHLFLYESWPEFSITSLLLVAILPIVLFLSSAYNLEGVLLSSCESIEGPLAKYFSYGLNGAFTIMILGLMIDRKSVV